MTVPTFEAPMPDVDTSPRTEDGPQPHQEPMYVEVEVADGDAVQVDE